VRAFVKDPQDELRLGMPASVFLSADQSNRPSAPAEKSGTRAAGAGTS